MQNNHATPAGAASKNDRLLCSGIDLPDHAGTCGRRVRCGDTRCTECATRRRRLLDNLPEVPDLETEPPAALLDELMRGSGWRHAPILDEYHDDDVTRDIDTLVRRAGVMVAH